jgi:hypothetical protein
LFGCESDSFFAQSRTLFHADQSQSAHSSGFLKATPDILDEKSQAFSALNGRVAMRMISDRCLMSNTERNMFGPPRRLVRSGRSEARDELLDFCCNFGIMNEQNRAIIEVQVAAEPIPASTKLELVRPDPLRIER